MNAHRVNQGQYPELKNTKSDFFFLPCRSEDQVSQTIQSLCTTRLPQNMGIPASEIQVLSPTKKGGAGTATLNKLLQSSLNPAAPGKQEKQYGDQVFRVGDRVMQTKNNYDILWKRTDGTAIGNGIFNGDVGIIKTINPAMEVMTVVFDDRVADYDFTQLNELEPAYAMTVHKSQGSEYPIVILPLGSAAPMLLSRNLFYTAVTRAQSMVVLVGREEIARAMVENNRQALRYTGLCRWLENESIP
jgi:exodeoxyribonuclease V alpha subunit